MKKILALVLALMITTGRAGTVPVYASEEDAAKESVSENEADSLTEAAGTESSQEPADLGLSAPSYLLMEASTGTVILSKSENEVLRPASITKVMTMILIFDALKEGKLKLEEEVTVSEYAASMGGSQVFLEAGEKQTVETMLKCIAVASANDACASWRNGIRQ